MSGFDNGFGNDIGEQIRKSVASSTNWINDVINDIRTNASNAAAAQKSYAGSPAYQEMLQEKARLQAEKQKIAQERTRQRQEMAKRMTSVSTGANGARYFFGGFLLLFGAAGISTAFESGRTVSTSIISLVMAGLAFFGAFKLFSKARKNKTYEKYQRLIGTQTYVKLSEFENTLGYSHKKVVKDLRDMISSGILKQSHIDDNEQYLMVTNEVYNNYLDSMASYDARKAVQELKEKEADAKQAAERGERPAELVAALDRGREYVSRIKAANEQIAGEEISGKLARLEEISGFIFEAVDKHPEKLPEIRKFMDYYMPTTLKLVESYREFERQPIKGDNIVKAEKEIEDTLDTINLAFENLASRLYEVDTMDLSADISVLKTLLAQEGLKDSDFNIQ